MTTMLGLLALSQAAENVPAAKPAAGGLPSLPDVVNTPASPVHLRPGAPAQAAGQTSPTVITSDDLQMDMEKKIATFIGHVKVVDPQGTMTADKMVVTMSQGDENANGVQRIDATGGVVIAQQGSKAMADEAVYTAADKIVVLSGAAQVETESGRVTGETVVYNMMMNTATVKGKPRMIILPGQGNRPSLFPTAPKPASSGAK